MPRIKQKKHRKHSLPGKTIGKRLEKKKYSRDIKHLAQRAKARELEERQIPIKKNSTEDVDDDVVAVDHFQELLLSFKTDKDYGTPLIDSSESSDEETNLANHTNMKEDVPEVNEHVADQNDDKSDDEVEKDSKVNNNPFSCHYTLDLHPSILKSVERDPKRYLTHKVVWPALGELQVKLPILNSEEIQTTLLDDKNFTSPGKVPERILSTNVADLPIRTKLINNLLNVDTNKKVKKNNPENISFTPLQCEINSIILNYQDLFYFERTFENCEDILFCYCLHVVNHVLNTRSLVINNNEKLSSLDKKTETPDELRDQGLVRPKVLILVPFRNSCYRIVSMIASILLRDKGANMINKARFDEEFTGSELFMPQKNRKPEDFELLFAGNVDDSFRIGINFTKKSLKLYADFYSADVIIASPLGLRMVIGAEGEKDRDFDFLSSIEILIMDQADVFLMQNWDHVTHILSHLHMQPLEAHGTDFSRVRTWALNGWTKYYRQTLLFSSIIAPELNAISARQCSNYAGAVHVFNPVTVGSISRILIPLPHVYRRFKTISVLTSADDRFNYFLEEIWPQFLDLSGILLYVPSYFDFVRLRNHMKNQDVSFVQICEYSKDGKVARARDMFFHNETKLLLYSERFHFFRRINVKGIRHIIFFQPPTYPHFYSELCNMMQDFNQNKAVDDGSYSVTVLFCKYDFHRLAGMARTSRASRIISSDKSVHMFTTGQS